MRTLILASALVMSVASVSAYKLSRLGYESTSYVSIHQEGPFEVRDYPALTLVSTTRDSLDPQERTGFMRLFRYITGGNETDRKIAMTTPVITTWEESEYRMSFVVPTQVAADGAPQPDNGAVQLETMPAGRFAVYRFSGVWTPTRFAEAKKKLDHWIKRKGLKPLGAAQIANYDPPFTPAMLRRNEVLVRIGE